jgi:hypothetical protein
LKFYRRKSGSKKSTQFLHTPTCSPYEIIQSTLIEKTIEFQKEGTAVKNYYFIFLMLAITLVACGNATTMSSTDQIVSGIYTAGALTLDAQAQMPTSTPKPLPVSTATSTPAPTLVPPITAPALTQPTNPPAQNPPSVYWQNSDAILQVDHSLCNNLAYVDDVTIPDGTVLAPGETFVKTWTLKNTGFCMWKAGFKLIFFEGDSMSGLDTEIGKTIASGRQANISIELTAPNSEGTYTGYWILSDDYGNPFGMPFYVQITVKNE